MLVSPLGTARVGNALAADMVMDRTTLGRNILPLERDGLIAVERGRRDRRSKTLRLTEAGAARFREAVKEWAQAQKQFEAVFGAERTIDLRALLHAVAATDLGINAVSSEE
jgi:DNA-binding MarR family transcriptional regulator